MHTTFTIPYDARHTDIFVQMGKFSKSLPLGGVFMPDIPSHVVFLAFSDAVSGDYLYKGAGSSLEGDIMDIIDSQSDTFDQCDVDQFWSESHYFTEAIVKIYGFFFSIAKHWVDQLGIESTSNSVDSLILYPDKVLLEINHGTATSPVY